MSEPAVALTDYALALETAVLTVLLQRSPRSNLQFWLTVYFISVSVASLCGGTVHGFLVDGRSSARPILWSTTLLSIGVTALATWAIAAEMLGSRQFARLVRIAALVQLAAYTVVVLLFTNAFWVAIAINLPAVLFLLAATIMKYALERRRPLITLASGLALSLVAAGLQQAGIAVHNVYFDHNALYHVNQAIALFILYRGGRGLLDQMENVHTAEMSQPRF